MHPAVEGRVLCIEHSSSAQGHVPVHPGVVQRADGSSRDVETPVDCAAERVTALSLRRRAFAGGHGDAGSQDSKAPVGCGADHLDLVCSGWGCRRYLYGCREVSLRINLDDRQTQRHRLHRDDAGNTCTYNPPLFAC